MMILSKEEENYLAHLKSNGINVCFIPLSSQISKCVKDLAPHMPSSLYETLQKCQKPGIMVEITAVILEVLGVSLQKINLIPLNHTNYGTYSNGTATGLVAEVQDGLFDTCIPYLSVTKERLQAIDFSHSVMSHSLGFLYRKTQAAPGITANPFASFSIGTWLLILALTATVSFIATSTWNLLQWRFQYSQNASTQIMEYISNFLDSFLIFTSQTTVSLPKSAQPLIQFSVALWALSMTIFSGLFAGTILITLVKETSTPPFQSLSSIAECVRVNKCTIMLYSLSGSYLLLLQQNGLFGSALEHHPAIAGRNMTTKILTGAPHYYLQFANYLEAQTSIAEDKRASSDQYMFFPSGFVDRWAFPTQKQSPLSNILSSAVTYAKDHGLDLAVQQRYVQEVPSRFSRIIELQIEPNPINVEGVSGSLLLLGIGCCISFFVLTLENGWRFFHPSGDTRSGNTSENVIHEKHVQGFKNAVELLKRDLHEQRLNEFQNRRVLELISSAKADITESFTALQTAAQMKLEQSENQLNIYGAHYN